MDLNDYQHLATRTANRPRGTVVAAWPRSMVNWALGLSGEAGEVANLVKKATFHGHDLDVDELGGELGDALWYIAVMAEALGLSLSDIALQNIAKLQARYPTGFSEEASRNRDGAAEKGG